MQFVSDVRLQVKRQRRDGFMKAHAAFMEENCGGIVKTLIICHMLNMFL